MTSSVIRKTIVAGLSIILLISGAFVFGFASSLHLKRSTSEEFRRQCLLQKGDAPESVRAEVLVALRTFQEGYRKRDPKELDAFMQLLFQETGNPLLLGTDTGEWVSGYRSVGQFIREDWLKWGISSLTSKIPLSRHPEMSLGPLASDRYTSASWIALCGFRRYWPAATIDGFSGRCSFNGTNVTPAQETFSVQTRISSSSVGCGVVCFASTGLQGQLPFHLTQNSI